MDSLLSESQLEALTQELDVAIAALDQSYGTARTSRGRNPVDLLPAAQRTKLEQVTGEQAASFWEKFKRAAHKDICEPSGIIH